jgi:hypothetical protein
MIFTIIVYNYNLPHNCSNSLSMGSDKMSSAVKYRAKWCMPYGRYNTRFCYLGLDFANWIPYVSGLFRIDFYNSPVDILYFLRKPRDFMVVF